VREAAREALGNIVEVERNWRGQPTTVAGFTTTRTEEDGSHHLMMLQVGG
jgi:hypothetical protein